MYRYNYVSAYMSSVYNINGNNNNNNNNNHDNVYGAVIMAEPLRKMGLGSRGHQPPISSSYFILLKFET